MKLVIISQMPEDCTRKAIRCFPDDWDVSFAAPGRLPAAAANADAIIPEHIEINGEMLDAMPSLKIIQTGAGYDNIDLNACRIRGITVCNAAGVNADAVAEHVLAFIFCHYKNMCLLNSAMKSGFKTIPEYCGGEISGKTVGIIGLGAVGQAVAKRCLALGMHVLGTTRNPKETEGIVLVNRDELLSQSDIVTVHASLQDDSRHMMNRETFSKMKPDALFINTSRGALVDEADLIEALQQGRIGGACLDVFEEEPLAADSPLRGLHNVILTPHTAGYPDGVHYHERRYAFFARNIEAKMKGEKPQNNIV